MEVKYSKPFDVTCTGLLDGSPAELRYTSQAGDKVYALTVSNSEVNFRGCEGVTKQTKATLVYFKTAREQQAETEITLNVHTYTLSVSVIAETFVGTTFTVTCSGGEPFTPAHWTVPAGVEIVQNSTEFNSAGQSVITVRSTTGGSKTITCSGCNTSASGTTLVKVWEDIKKAYRPYIASQISWLGNYQLMFAGPTSGLGVWGVNGLPPGMTSSIQATRSYASISFFGGCVIHLTVNYTIYYNGTVIAQGTVSGDGVSWTALNLYVPPAADWTSGLNLYL